MRAHLCGILLLFCASWSAAATNPEAYVVKLSSWSDFYNTQYRGSGLLVQYEGSVYVLTSEHVLLHDNDSGTHLQFQLNGNPQIFKMTYIVSDWGMGLALLKVPELSPSDKYPLLDDLAKSQLPSVGARAITVGFPSTSNSILVDPRGTVSSTTDISDALVDVPQMVEIKGAHGEFGMSGGAVIGPDFSIQGILSHQNSDTTNQMLYAIPIHLASRWAIGFIEHPNQLPRIVRTSMDFQKDDGLQVRSGHWIFEWRADPACLDGTTTSKPNGEVDYNTLTGMEIHYDNSTWQPTEGPLLPSQVLTGATWDLLTQKFPMPPSGGAEKTICITGFMAKDLTHFQTSVPPILNETQFFRLASDSSLKPTAVLDENNMNLNSNQATEYIADYEAIGSAGGAPSPLSDRLNAIANLAQSDPPPDESIDESMEHTYPIDYLDASDMDRALNDPVLAPAWKDFQKTHPDGYASIRNALESLQAILAQYTL